MNSAPHFIIGLTGKRNMTPFGRDSSPGMNVVWGTINLLGATKLILRADTREDSRHDPDGWLPPVMAGGLCWSAFQFLYELRSRQLAR